MCFYDKRSSKTNKRAIIRTMNQKKILLDAYICKGDFSKSLSTELVEDL